MVKPSAVEQLAHAHQVLDVAARVHALTLGALGRADAAEFALPVAKDVRLDADQLGDLADAEIELRRELAAVTPRYAGTSNGTPGLPSSRLGASLESLVAPSRRARGGQRCRLVAPVSGALVQGNA
jgi:hypothetical protein